MVFTISLSQLHTCVISSAQWVMFKWPHGCFTTTESSSLQSSCDVLSWGDQMKAHADIIYRYLTSVQINYESASPKGGELLLGPDFGNDVVCGDEELRGHRVRRLKLSSNSTNVCLSMIANITRSKLFPNLAEGPDNKSAQIRAIASTSFRKTPVPKLPNTRFRTPFFSNRYRMRAIRSPMTDLIRPSVDWPLFLVPRTSPALTAAHVSTSMLIGFVQPPSSSLTTSTSGE